MSTSRPYLLSLCLILSQFALSGPALAERQAEDDARMITDPRVQHRSYVYAGTGETLPYALFVPSSYQPGEPTPLVVALHGLGRSHDWLMGYEGFLDMAEEKGMLVVTPLGYIRRGWYGSRPTEDPADAAHSEADVMAVLALMRQEFSVDEDRTYLWGHSMGGAGTYHIASRNPGLFAALAVAAPAPRSDLSPQVLEPVRDTPILVLQGTADELVPVEQTRRWVDGMQELGMPHVYVEIEGADHTVFIASNAGNMSKVMHFFDIVRKRYRQTD